MADWLTLQKTQLGEVPGLNPFLRRREDSEEPSFEVGDALNLDWRLFNGTIQPELRKPTREKLQSWQLEYGSQAS